MRSTCTILIVASTALLFSCTDGPASPADNFDRRGLLSASSSRVILPALAAARDAAAQLAADSAALQTARDSGAADVDALVLTAQESWRAAMLAWQRVEVMQLGPLGMSGTVTGGQDGRDAIYSWPTTSACRIDQMIVDTAYAAPTFFSAELVNVRGLDAVEYLLFFTAPQNQCPAQLAINSTGQWQALGEVEVARRRAAYASLAAADVATRIGALHDTWQSDFATELATAGESTSGFSTAQAAVDELFAAMFYVELDVKDMKLADPSGLSGVCGTDVCLGELESPWADHGKENIVANLQAFADLFRGGSDTSELGFDDFLAARGAADLGTQMFERLAAAEAGVSALPTGLGASLQNDVTAVRAAHAEVKAFTDLLKSQFVSVLGLRVPDEGAGDND